MSLERLVDDLARTLAQPMPRRRALRVLGGSVLAATLPGLSPGQSGAAVSRPVARRAASITCQNLTQSWTCPTRKYITCGTSPGECIDACQGPGRVGCGSGDSFDCCIDALGRDGYIVCRNGRCVPSCKAIQDSTPERLTACGEECCFPNEVCRQGRCVRPCPGGRAPCGTTCCKPGQTCTRGRCCPNGRVCGETCCPTGQKCALSGSRRVCCANDRIVSRQIRGRETRFCCPTGTRRAAPFEACCPPGDPDCCEDEMLRFVPDDPDPNGDDLAPLSPYVGRQFCVRGRRRRL